MTGTKYSGLLPYRADSSLFLHVSKQKQNVAIAFQALLSLKLASSLSDVHELGNREDEAYEEFVQT